MKRCRIQSRPMPPRKAAMRGPPKQESNRRLTSLGLSRHDDDEIQTEALAIVERFRVWTGQQPCVITRWRTGEVHEFKEHPSHPIRLWKVVVQWAHIVATRGSWAGDFGVAAPLCDLLHRRQEDDPAFFSAKGLDPILLAKAHAIHFFRDHPDDATWLLRHAVDGDVLSLAQAGLEAR